MIIYAVDDEILALKLLENAIMAAAPDAQFQAFSNPEDLLKKAKKQPCHVAFMDIEMREMSGIELAKKLTSLCPSINIVFVTGYRQYMGEAWDLMASGYVTKPVTKEKIMKQLSSLRYSAEEDLSEKKRVRIQCFGNFEVFVDGKPLKFQYELSKEVLAYLTDRRGADCTTSEVSNLLWDDNKNHISYFQHLRTDIRDALEAVNCEDLVQYEWGKLRLNTELVDCDYYDYLAGKVNRFSAYHGEYMKQYAWSAQSSAKDILDKNGVY